MFSFGWPAAGRGRSLWSAGLVVLAVAVPLLLFGEVLELRGVPSAEAVLTGFGERLAALLRGGDADLGGGYPLLHREFDSGLGRGHVCAMSTNRE